MIIIYKAGQFGYDKRMKLTPGQFYAIKRVLNPEDRTAYRRQLLAMGLTPGVRMEVRRVAPLGDPVQFEVNGFSLSLRRRDLEDFLQLEQVEA